MNTQCVGYLDNAYHLLGVGLFAGAGIALFIVLVISMTIDWTVVKNDKLSTFLMATVFTAGVAIIGGLGCFS